MADTQALANLPSDHWIHGALARAGKDGKKKPVSKGKLPPMMAAKKPAPQAGQGAPGMSVPGDMPSGMTDTRGRGM